MGETRRSAMELLLLLLVLVLLGIALGLLKVLWIPLHLLLKLIFLPIHVALNVLSALASSCVGMGCLTLLVLLGIGWLLLHAVF